MTPRIVVMLVMVVCVSVGAAAGAQTQESKTQDAIASLLSELRALRVTLETVVTAGANGQLILGRLQLQDERLKAASVRLEGAREQLARTQKEAVDLPEQIAEVEEAIKNGPQIVFSPHSGDLDREVLKEALKWHKKRLAEVATEIPRLIAEETTLASEFAMEQSRWFELNRRLQEIEQNLARRISSTGVR